MFHQTTLRKLVLLLVALSILSVDVSFGKEQGQETIAKGHACSDGERPPTFRHAISILVQEDRACDPIFDN